MAQSIDDRIASALKPGSRLADCEALLIDVRAEAERVEIAQAKADDRRSDPTVSETDAADANLEVEEAKLRLIRLDRAASALGQAIATKKASESEKAARNRYEQVRKRRDDLAAELVERVAPMIDELAAIFARIAENDSEIAQLARRMDLPGDCETLKGAEIVARGAFAGQYGARRLVDIELPLFAHNGRAWPSTGNAKAAAQRAEQGQRDREKANADREASKARYLISRGDCPLSFPAAITADGLMPVSGTIDVWCYPNQAELNRERDLRVEPWTEAGAAKVAAHAGAFAAAIV
jgi:hypothetical protein